MQEHRDTYSYRQIHTDTDGNIHTHTWEPGVVNQELGAGSREPGAGGRGPGAGGREPGSGAGSRQPGAGGQVQPYFSKADIAYACSLCACGAVWKKVLDRKIIKRTLSGGGFLMRQTLRMRAPCARVERFGEKVLGRTIFKRTLSVFVFFLLFFLFLE